MAQLLDETESPQSPFPTLTVAVPAHSLGHDIATDRRAPCLNP